MREIKILVLGVGGLGCPASLVLAEGGVATLGLMDPDKVELSNLHRQILYSDADLGRPKVEAAAGYLNTHHPKTKTILIPEAFSPANAEKILSQYDLVIDGLDRLEKKFLLNDWCVKLRKSFVHAGVVKFEGQVLPVLPGETACLRCLIPKIPPPFAMPTCQQAGVLGSFSQVIGYLQGHEALRLAERHGPFRLWKVDAQKREARSIIPRRDPECGSCGHGKVAEEMSEPACAV
ncbi:MAG TPA: HesA/MoeB/ThiF family protein [bacterium]|nr:HesA/MoeB/ThiF family protein [bacterium]